MEIEKEESKEGDKKIALIRLIQILENETDYDHPITQQKILKILNDHYGLLIKDRKFVGRNVKLLQDLFESNPYSSNAACQVSLVTDKRRGSYFEKRLFENSELRLLIDSVLQSKYIPEKHSADLIDKLCLLSNRYFKANVDHIFAPNYKTENKQLFYNIEVIVEAMEKKKKISFDYNKYGTDKKLHKTVSHTENPYHLILHNQRYYLMCKSDSHRDVGFLRVDKITKIKIENAPLIPLNKFPEYKNGYDFKNKIMTLPYMFGDDFEKIEFVANVGIVDDIVDTFGNEALIREISDNKIEVTVQTSLRAMEYWAMQYLNHVEVVSPDYLREKIRSNLDEGRKKYE